MNESDVIVIGGGIAGASAAFAMASRARIVLLEAETQYGVHATGRSAASFTENYGPPEIRRLAKASRSFLESPPEGFAAHPLMSDRGMITIARRDQLDVLTEELANARRLNDTITEISVPEVLERVPFLNPQYLAGAIIEPHSREIDVHGLHSGFLAGARRLGCDLRTNARVCAIRCVDKGWEVDTPTERFRARIIVNAAGAWADAVARMADVGVLGLVPKRRTAFLVPRTPEVPASGWPLVNDVGGEFYFKCDAGNIFVSPADATPSEPMDAFPDDFDVAVGVDRFARATTVSVRRVLRSWAGLRTFAPDGVPVVGFDARADGFFWLAGQGGYGIKTSPALSVAAAALVLDRTFPPALSEAGLSERDISPARFCK